MDASEKQIQKNTKIVYLTVFNIINIRQLPSVKEN